MPCGGSLVTGEDFRSCGRQIYSLLLKCVSLCIILGVEIFFYSCKHFLFISSFNRSSNVLQLILWAFQKILAKTLPDVFAFRFFITTDQIVD